MTYPGVLPQIIKGNKLIEKGVRMPKSVPQIPFKGVTAPKIERAGVVKRLSPSMNKKRTFSHMDTVNFSIVSLPSPAPYDPYSTPYPNQRINPPQPYSYPPQPYPTQTYPSQGYLTTPYVMQYGEPRKRYQAGLSTINSGSNASREARNWVSTANSSNRELRTNLRFLREVQRKGWSSEA